MSFKTKEIPEPTGEHPYSVQFKYTTKDQDGLNMEQRKIVYFSGSKKEQHKLIERVFIKKYGHLRPFQITVNWLG